MRREDGVVEPSWRVWVDTGGTFTDCVAIDPHGAMHRAKVLSNGTLRGTVEAIPAHELVRVRERWAAISGFATGLRLRPLGSGEQGAVVLEHRADGLLKLEAGATAELRTGTDYELLTDAEAAVLAARLVTGTPSGAALPRMELRLATTLGTNALLERHGTATALFTTRGFRDLLRIGTQQRPDLFALRVSRSPALADLTCEVPGRLDAAGVEIEPLDLRVVERSARAVLARGIRSAAVALVNSYRNPVHERAVGALLSTLGFEHVALSTDLAATVQLLPRAETAVVDAYLGPLLDSYLRGVERGLTRGSDAESGTPSSSSSSRVLVMTSAGGLATPEEFRAKDSLLSGPAGGVLGAIRAARSAGFERVIAFDMGGTSTDVARVEGDLEYRWHQEVAGVRLLAPALAIESVAAGGGSICSFDRLALRVGPESAGAEPGPACYGAGGPLTVTDVNLLLGRLHPGSFGIPVRVGAAEEAFATLRERLAAERGERPEPDSLLLGLLEIANERMAEAIRTISVREGYDPSAHALVAFGGAGGQHACDVAERLGIRQVVLPPDGSLLSAWGMGHAGLERVAYRQLLRPLEEVEEELEVLDRELVARAMEELGRVGVAPDRAGVRRRIATIRFAGQESTLTIDYEPARPLGPGFRTRYREVFGHLPEELPVEVEALRVIVASAVPRAPTAAAVEHWPAEPSGSALCMTRGGRQPVDVYERGALSPGATLPGPALIREPHTVIYVAAGWAGTMHGSGALVLTRAEEQPVTGADGRDAAALPRHRDGGGPTGAEGGRQQPEAVAEELFTSRFEAIARQMGEQLQRTALSVNIRERLDFSCALLDPTGELVANAPHIPVHLGALGLCVRSLAAALPLAPGDVAVTNHPGFGGSHLPDVTVVTPVHDAGGVLIGYVASRAHHAEIGGARPGSMPPGARTLEEEGVVIEPMLLLHAGQPRWNEMRRLLGSGRFPSRSVESNIADLQAQMAANRAGAELLCRLATDHGAELVQRQMKALKTRAQRLTADALSRLSPGEYTAEERLDDGSPLRVRILIHGPRAVVDLAGSAGVHPGNLNATPAIVRSAVIYVLRLLVDEPIPLNEGLMAAVDVRIPPGLLNPDFSRPPAACPAVVGGNTEVSQRLVDTLLKALGLVACSQGTMNNVLWGSDRFGFYETVAGGAGAGPGWVGESGVHTHMTNTRVTDVEVLERLHPVRVERFCLRPGSGGAGRWRGGDGLIRELRFLAPVSLSVLSQHRVEGPYGMDGGEPGAPGRQTVIRATGEVLELRPLDGCEMLPGDRFVLETPGGGGWGKASR
jgi:5-oxoprolinase (ATP-hydrolysing)